MPTQKLTHEILIAAIEGFDAQKTRIDAKIAELRQMLNAARKKVVRKAAVKATAKAA